MLPDGIPVQWVDHNDCSLVYHTVEQLVAAEASNAPDGKAHVEFLVAFLSGLLKAGVNLNIGKPMLLMSIGLSSPKV